MQTFAAAPVRTLLYLTASYEGEKFRLPIWQKIWHYLVAEETDEIESAPWFQKEFQKNATLENFKKLCNFKFDQNL